MLQISVFRIYTNFNCNSVVGKSPSNSCRFRFDKTFVTDFTRQHALGLGGRLDLAICYLFVSNVYTLQNVYKFTPQSH
jgi:hypothetical protein